MRRNIASIAFLASILSFWFVLDLYSSFYLKKVCSDWPIINADLATFNSDFPATTQNQEAKGLSRLYNNLNYDVHLDISTNPLLDNNNFGFHSVRKDLELILEAQPRLPSQSNAPTKILSAFLELNNEVINDISELLVEGDNARYDFDTNVEPFGKLEYLGWHRDIVLLLLVKALLAQDEDSDTDSWSYIYAASRLVDSSFSQPLLTSQLIAITSAQKVLSIIAKMKQPVPEWVVEWPNYDLQAMMHMAYTQHAYEYLNLSKRGKIIGIIGKVNKELLQPFGAEPIKIGLITQFVSIAFERQYLRLYSANIIKVIRKTSLERASAESNRVANISTSPLKDQVPRWVSTSDLFAATEGMIEVDWLNTYWHRLDDFILAKEQIISNLLFKEQMSRN